MTSPIPDRTLRDDFAMSALAGLLAGSDGSEIERRIAQGRNPIADLARCSYDLADAMLEARFVAPDPLGRDARGVTQGMRDYLAAQPRKGRR